MAYGGRITSNSIRLGEIINMAFIWEKGKKFRCRGCKTRVLPTGLPNTSKVHPDYPEQCPWCSLTGFYLEPLDGVDRMNLETARPKTLEELLTPLDKGFLKSLHIRL